MAGRIYNHPNLKERRRALRRTATPSEITIWEALRNRRLQELKFRRQFSVGAYVLDSYCPAEKLAIELDSAHHFTVEGKKADVERDLFLTGLFIRVLRFENREVEENLELVLEKIKSHLTLQPLSTSGVNNAPLPTPGVNNAPPPTLVRQAHHRLSLAKEGAKWPRGKKKNDNGEVES